MNKLLLFKKGGRVTGEHIRILPTEMDPELDISILSNLMSTQLCRTKPSTCLFKTFFTKDTTNY